MRVRRVALVNSAVASLDSWLPRYMAVTEIEAKNQVQLYEGESQYPE